MDLLIKEEKQSSIQAISKNTVHQICSGQVVLNLATAVKELVENSLDAGATVIEIRLKEYGSELVEVTDNGSGVEEKNFQALTLKHHTSKLREFSDLVSVATFGFRGEALSSLCALSEMIIITRHSSTTCGTRLEYDHRGEIKAKKSCARQIGTTVCLQNLFSTLPVRHKEFLRNLRRDFAKMTQLLYAYCLVSTGTKISCSNQTKNGSRSVVVSTQGGATVRENIACVFGTKQVQNLIEFQQKSPGEQVRQEYNISEESIAQNPFEIEGCISSCAHGQGRSTADRQFFYVNSRPCEPTKVIKVVNEVYHHFNQHQYPFVFLNLKLARSSVDVNVTPDKRQVFLDHEKLLIATVKESILQLYETIPSTFNFQNIPESIPSISPTTENTNLADRFKRWSNPSGSNNSESPKSSLGRGKGTKRFMDSKKDDARKSKLHCINQFFSSTRKEETGSISTKDQKFVHNSVSEVNTTIVLLDNDNEIKKDIIEIINDAVEITNSEQGPNEKEVEQMNFEMCVNNSEHNTEYIAVGNNIHHKPEEISAINTEVIFHQDEVTDVIDNETVSDINADTSQTLCNNDTSSDIVERVAIIDDEEICDVNRQTINFSINLNDIKQGVKLRKEINEKRHKDSVTVKFRAGIDPADNQAAESELRKEISKEMFAKMEILGQFNLGFIIARLDSDLFIIDQHATDEKFNFETLQKMTVLKNQRLVIPQKLELTAVNESILMENEEIFRKNGFDFIFDETAQPTKRVQLTAIPVCKNWEFGKEDIDELLFMLQDSPHTMCRPSRVRSMFASQACRKSVMIGTALSKVDMRRLVDQMGQIEHPWNCPHGRPTMRHLVNLDLIHNG